jgi:hypothetical protein
MFRVKVSPYFFGRNGGQITVEIIRALISKASARPRLSLKRDCAAAFSQLEYPEKIFQHLSRTHEKTRGFISTGFVYCVDYLKKMPAINVRLDNNRRNS